MIAYLALAFAVAWLLWAIAGAVSTALELALGARSLLYLPGTFAPGIVALLLTAREQGRGGVRMLLGRVLRWRVAPGWYLLAIGFMAAVKLAAAVLYRAASGEWPPFGQTPAALMLIAVGFSTPFQAGEEIGWRGYALPRMAASMGLAAASVLLGVIWAVWHLPLFFIPGSDILGQPFLPFLLSVTALSVAMAWVFAGTGGSLLLVMLMHAAVNNTTAIVPATPAQPGSPLSVDAPLMAWLTAAVLWAAAGYLLLRMSRQERPPAS